MGHISSSTRNAALATLEPLIGHWDLSMSNAWFLDAAAQPARGWATFERLEDIYVVFRWSVGDRPPSVNVIGHSDPAARYYMLYHDDRGVARLFEMGFDGERWNLLRENADFYQRFDARIDGDRIIASWEASEDEGETWRKDFDLLFERRP